MATIFTPKEPPLWIVRYLSRDWANLTYLLRFFSSLGVVAPCDWKVFGENSPIKETLNLTMQESK
jgi:hypothetical protein